MISSSTFRRASIPVSGRTVSEAPAGSAPGLPKRCRSSACRPQTRAAGTRAATGLFIISVLLAMAAAPSTAADPLRPGHIGPDEADLRYFFGCSKAATMRVLNIDEAAGCARVYLRIKLSFVPGVGLDDFDRLRPQEKAAVNLAGYGRYVEWRSENSAEVEALWNAPISSSDFAAN